MRSGCGASVGLRLEDRRQRKENEDFGRGPPGLRKLPGSRARRLSRRSPTASAAQRAAAPRPRPRVRGFLDGFVDMPETMEVQRAGATIVSSLHGWINSLGRQGPPSLPGMGCTFTAIVLRGRVAHLLHVGDTRAYRLSGERMTCLTTDHVRQQEGRRPFEHAHPRARGGAGSAPRLRHPAWWRCTTVFCCAATAYTGFLTDQMHCRHLAPPLRSRRGRRLRWWPLRCGSDSTDNCTALVLDVVALPTAGSADINAAIRLLPVILGTDSRRYGRWIGPAGADLRRPLHSALRRRR